MLNGKRATVYLIPVVVIGSLVLGAQFLRTSVPTEEYQECLYHNETDRSKQAECKTDETIWQRTLSDPVSYYTLWLTIFTGALAGVGIIQGYLIWRQIGLSRDEFNATHRPEIVVHTALNATAVPIGGGTALGIQIIYFNKGTGPAKKVQLFASIIPMRFRTELQDGIAMNLVGEPDRPVISGQPYAFTTWSTIRPEQAEYGDIQPDGRRPNPSVTVYCVGAISYEDGGGVQRTTGFCWEWNRTKWIRVTGNSYDYAY